MTILAFNACCLPAFALQPIAGSRLTGCSFGQARRGGDGKISGANRNKGLVKNGRKSIHRMDVPELTAEALKAAQTVRDRHPGDRRSAGID